MNQIFDIHPGYLGNQQVLDEYQVLLSGPPGQSDCATRASTNPGMQQWMENSWANYLRYRWLEAELDFRKLIHGFRKPGYQYTGCENEWPESVCTPTEQFKIISSNRINIETARIPIPKNAQQIWAQHKYSVMARDNNLYREMGPRVANLKTDSDFADFTDELTYFLRMQPGEGGLRNAVQHMWGHVSGDQKVDPDFADWPLSRLVNEIKLRATNQEEFYLLHSTALTELQLWLPE